jgi:hypothetical protein
MATLHIERASDGWTDSLRAYDVIINEKKRAELGPGEHRDIDVEAGKVEVYLTLDSGRSRAITLDVKAGEEVRLRCRPRSALTALYRILFQRKNYMHLERA